jgi:GT2 family glycosyltransferase
MRYQFIMSSKIAVVIPVYNGRDYLPDCLDSLNEQTYQPLQIIVIDNASTDGSAGFVNSQFTPLALNSQISIIVNKKNLGFAKACNQGIEEAIRSEADYVFLLNQDTVCEKNCLEELCKAVEQDKNIFAAQALMLMWRNKNLIQTSGDRIHFLGFGHSGDYKLDIRNSKLEIKDITYASGAAMFINAKVLKEVGLFDEDLFMYHEDMDLCWRARLLGYKIILASKAIVYHKYTEGIPPHRWYWSERNRTLTLLKLYKWPTLVLIFPPWLLMEAGALFYSLMTGWFTLKIKSYFSALSQLPKTLAKRSKIQKTRKTSDREMSNYLEAKFDFAGLEHPLLKYLVNPIFGIYWRVVRLLIFW